VQTQLTHEGRHPVYKAMLKPLTLCGVERRLFFLALLLGAATFNLQRRDVRGRAIDSVFHGLP